MTSLDDRVKAEWYSLFNNQNKIFIYQHKHS